MSASLIRTIEAMDDRTRVRVLEEFASQLFEGMDSNPEQIIAAIPASYQEAVAFNEALAISDEQWQQPLSQAASAALAKDLLLGFAADPAMADALQQVVDRYRDDALLAGTILATGVAISMIIVACTTKFKGTVGSFEISKEAADPELVDKVLSQFPKLS
ncbi:hypothetical protein [Halioxenophilus sp. WMMB6]|uniref:hypothetical protein n=1 Tax=Halioxenophilus sp. WMMB6 TaxID=3073815 RepID=UPI00295F53CE|nr:hypothetical protein [Halioxenophilus sp. WMMB6]